MGEGPGLALGGHRALPKTELVAAAQMSRKQAESVP